MSILLPNFLGQKLIKMSFTIKTILIQLIIGVLTVLLVGAFRPAWHFSLLIGVVTMWVATLPLLVINFINQKSITHPKGVLRRYYIGQAIKYALLIAAVLVYVHVLQLMWLPFIIGLFAIQMSSLLLAAQMKRMVSA